MRKIRLFMADPSDVESMTAMEVELNAMLLAHPDARLTWLQSSGTSTSVAASTTLAEHLLTCAAEYEEKVARSPASQQKPAKRRSR